MPSCVSTSSLLSLCRNATFRAFKCASRQPIPCPRSVVCGNRGIFSAAIQSQLNAILVRHEAVSKSLLAASSGKDGAVDPRALGKLSREAHVLERNAATVRAYHASLKEIEDLEGLIAEAETSTAGGGNGGAGAGAGGARSEGDAEMARLARAELQTARAGVDALELTLRRALLPHDDADSRDAILEFRPGTGGDEAALFAGDMLAMYASYAALKGWRWHPLAIARTETGGVKEASISVGGEGAYGRLKCESGVHRVQRVPATESAGRIHTSTMSLAVLPEAEEVDIDVKLADLRVDTYRAQGAGGQHVNTTDSAVRITHLPSGLVVSCQDERSQHQNRARAMRVLRARLFEAERERQVRERSAARRLQIGTGARSERIRTYNFSQCRVTDHRISITKHDMDAMMRGEILDEFIDALQLAAEEEELTLLEVAHSK